MSPSRKRSMRGYAHAFVVVAVAMMARQVANTTPAGYMTNNVEVDNRGFIFVTDRNGSGLDILELTGKARLIGHGQDHQPLL